MHARKRIQQVWSIVGLTFVVGFIAFVAYDYLVNAPRARLAENDLKREFQSIVSLPGAVVRNHHSLHRSQQASVGGTYATSVSYVEIRKYYDEELARRGWTFHREREIRDWGRNLGGRTVEYCKGEYRASLQYAGERADYGWVFALDLSWGLDSLMDRWLGNVCK